MNKGLTFNDVLLPPKWGTDIKSREECDTSSFFSRNVRLAVPVASANMRTVTGIEMCTAMAKTGGIGILHRNWENTNAWADAIETLGHAVPSYGNYGISIGLTNWPYIMTEVYIIRQNHPFPVPKVVVLDVAHAGNDNALHSVETLIMYRKDKMLADRIPRFDIVVGNIATAEAASRYKELDIDGIKVGVGGGAACTTRIMTGCGVPQLGAVMDIARVLKHSKIKLIADGGITEPGDVVKALAAGANCVMMGKELSMAKESTGWENLNTKKFTPSANHWCKTYEGEASFRNDRAPEGVKQNILLPIGQSPKTVKEIIVDLYHDGIQSGMSYQNAKTIPQLQENAEFIEVSTNTLIENKARY